MRGAWIEMRKARLLKTALFRSLPVRGAWIEIDVKCLKSRKILSLPVRGAWIEI